MKLEQQVVSLELAQKLKALGVKQESYFWYGEDGYLWREGVSVDGSFAAFTVAELGEMLPAGLWDDEKYKMLTVIKGKRVNKSRRYEAEWAYYYCPAETGTTASDQIPKIPFYEHTEADARAKMLVYLIENKLITL